MLQEAAEQIMKQKREVPRKLWIGRGKYIITDEYTDWNEIYNEL